MNPDERRQLENQLLVMGLKGLNDSGLIQQLADLVSNWQGDKHEFLQDLINECDAANRYEMYNAIAPKLRFQALPLSTYESRIAERAGELVSQRRMRVEGRRPYPVEVSGQQFEQVPESLATAAIATLRCHRCGTSARFVSNTPVAAMIAGRKAGWVRDMVMKKEVCPECEKAHAN